MNIALLHTINNDYIICDLELLDEEPCYYLKNAYSITENELGTGDASFRRYPKHTKDEGCLIYTDKIVTMVEPDPRVAELYLKVISE